MRIRWFEWRVLRAVPLSLLVLAGTGNALAQAYPVKPIRIVFGTPAGGGSDLMARLVGQKLTEAWGQQVVVDPRPGASGNIAAEIVARAAPDGYTLYVAFGSHTTNPSLYAKLPFDTLRDFTAITLISTQSNALTVHPSVPVRSARELVDLARRQPGRLTYQSAGNGSPSHLGMEQLKMVTGADLLHIPYKGAAPAVVDQLAGQVDSGFLVLRTALPHARAGRLRVLAIASRERSVLAPEVPTLEEGGFKGVELLTWHGLLGPAGLPGEIVARLHAAVAQGMQAGDFRQKLARDGVDVVAGTPAQFDAWIRAEIPRWEKVIRVARVKID